MNEVKLPRLLSNSFEPNTSKIQEAARLRPVKASITLNSDLSSKAELTLKEDDNVLNLHDFVEIYGINGSLGVFRVVRKGKKIKKHRTYSLNHAIDLFNDVIVPGTEKLTGSVSQVLQTVIGYQYEKINDTNYWAVGTVECNEDYTFENNYNFAFEILDDIAETFADSYYFTFDFSTFPWKVNFVAFDNNVASELRLSRNIETIDIEESDTNQCTRLILAVDSSNDESVPQDERGVDYRTYNDSYGIQHWGIIEKKETVDTSVVSNISNWADKYFNLHRYPDLSINISGEELSQRTGEPMDRLYLGRKCRVVLAEYDTVFNERIVSVKYPDVLRDPLHFESTLSLKRKTASNMFANERKTAKRNYSRVSRQIGGLHQELWDANMSMRGLIDFTYEHFRLEFDDLANGLHSELEMTASHLRTEFTDDVNSLRGTLEMTASHLRTEFADDVNSLRSALEITASHMRAEFTNEAASLRTEIEQTASGWRTALSGVMSNGKVTAASIATAINDQGQAGVAISGDWIALDGNTKLTGALKITDGNLSVLKTAYFGNNVYITGGNSLILQTSGTPATNYNLTPAIMANMVVKAQAVGNVLKLWTYGEDQSSDPALTFSKATSLSGSWSGRKYIVTAKQGTTTVGTKTGIVYDGLVPTGSVSKGGKDVSRVFIVYSDDGEGNADEEIMRNTVTISASDVYGDGWGAAYGEVTLPNTNTSSGNFIVYAPPATVDGSAEANRYSVANNGDNAVDVNNVDANGNVLKTIAKFTHNKYTGGYNACYGTVKISNTGTSGTIALGYGGSTTLYAQAKDSNGTYQNISGVTVTSPARPWLYSTTDAATQGNLTLGTRYKISVGSSGAAMGVWQVPSAPAPTVSDWDRTNFSSSSTDYGTGTRKLSIPVSVKVNGTTYSHTFTTGGFKVSKRDSTHMYIYCGNTCIGLWSV